MIFNGEEANSGLLVIARHGECDPRGNLSERGRMQMRALARWAKNRVNGGRILLVASPITRARQSAEAFSEGMVVVPEAAEVLASPGGSGQSFVSFVMERMRKNEIMVVITHLECAAYFASSFCQAAWNIDSWPDALKAGQAYLLDPLKRRIDVWGDS